MTSVRFIIRSEPACQIASVVEQSLSPSIVCKMFFDVEQQFIHIYIPIHKDMYDTIKEANLD